MKIVVAYSGGLDTSVMIKWLKEKYNAEIITATGNLGQKTEMQGLKEKAYKTGASKVYIDNLTEDFVLNYIFPALKAGALYENRYPLATALGRPLLAKYLVSVAKKENADMIAHGCTGKGNDQVRFEVSISALSPEMKVIAPLREWEFKSREDEIRYAKKNDIPVSATVSSPYSIDENIWGRSIECGILEDPTVEPPEDAFALTNSPEHAPDTAEYVTVEFESGIPVKLNNERLDPVQLIQSLNTIGGKHGIGRIDLVENRLVGIKSREIYEAPAATILHFAHTELERLTLDKYTFNMKSHFSQEYAKLVYNGLWFSQLRKALDAFVDVTQTNVSGNVRLKLFRGNMILAARESVYSLYNPQLATYTDEDTFDHKASEGFIKIYGLPLKTFSRIQHPANGKSNTKSAKKLTHAKSK